MKFYQAQATKPQKRKLNIIGNYLFAKQTIALMFSNGQQLGEILFVPE